MSTQSYHGVNIVRSTQSYRVINIVRGTQSYLGVNIVRSTQSYRVINIVRNTQSYLSVNIVRSTQSYHVINIVRGTHCAVYRVVNEISRCIVIRYIITPILVCQVCDCFYPFNLLERFLSEVFQQLYCSSYHFQDMKQPKGPKPKHFHFNLLYL